MRLQGFLFVRVRGWATCISETTHPGPQVCMHAKQGGLHHTSQVLTPSVVALEKGHVW